MSTGPTSKSIPDFSHVKGGHGPSGPLVNTLVRPGYCYYY